MNRIVLSQIQALALNVWLESVRDKVLQLMAVLGLSFLIFTLVLGEMAVGGRLRVLQTAGFWIIGIWGIFTIIYLGSGILKNEIQRKTVYLILSRPVHRSVFLFGKFTGILLVLSSLFFILSLSWLILLWGNNVEVIYQHFIALFFIFGEWTLLTALSIFFASFTSPLLHNFFIIGIAFLGHWSKDLLIFSGNTENPFLEIVLKAIYYLIPNLDAVNFRSAALYNIAIDLSLIVEGVGVLLGWIAVALVGANIIFVKRKLL